MQNSEFRMVDISDKAATKRTCLASGKLHAAPSTIERIKAGNLPKGNPLPLAEAAGIMAVKKTSEILPLCHPLPIDSASIRFEFSDSFVKVFCETTAFAKTGVEMEALNGANAALLCIYDLTKGIDPALEISDLHLIKKSGGKSGDWLHPKENITNATHSAQNWKGISFSVITLSDRCSSGELVDTSGPAITQFANARGAHLNGSHLINDDEKTLKDLLFKICEGSSQIIFCTGGTGIGPRDITPETILSLGGKIIPGFGELMRKESAYITPYAWLSRCEAFLLKNSLSICLPGSKKAVIENLSAIEKIIPHAMEMILGGKHA